jgi:hypothetical protein
MDTMFMNRITAEIHKLCVTKIVDQGLYESDPVSFRRRVEDCFTNCVSQQEFVEKGIQKYFIINKVNMWLQPAIEYWLAYLFDLFSFREWLWLKKHKKKKNWQNKIIKL